MMDDKMNKVEIASFSSNESDDNGDDNQDQDIYQNNVDKRRRKVDNIACNHDDVTNEQQLKTHNSIDNFFIQYGKFTSKSLFTERGIKLVQWTMWLISQVTKDNQRFSKDLSPSVRKVYSDLSMMRYVLRFYGFPSALDAVRNPGSWAGAPPNASSWKDKRIVKLSDLMAWSMLFYHPLEHVAYANWTMPKLFHRVDGNKMSAWSCRFWLAYIAADWISSILKNRELQEYKKTLLLQGDNAALKIIEVDKSIKINRLQIVRNFFFAPPCLSWSLNKWATDPLLSENVINGMSWAEAVVCLYQSILSL